jgi:predicted DNA-binding protein (MmcQ/YjbR family)
MPFKDEYLIFKVFGKWLAVIPLHDYELNISVKCDPAKDYKCLKNF